ncbi:CRTAC1 family protein [Pleurocapsa sp. PCC 7319]|uniref:CRTAC1 family protein n=1 Tax=Pleurocapsa sp. PCC 7319 TaxID=118161 RepID=UPI000345A6E0|nr:CRTAC1 family protein [Pleurocapsa sp. PCC 7319]
MLKDFKYIPKKLLRFSQLVIATLVGTIVLSILIALLLPNLKTHWHFSRLPVALATYDLFDLGVVDANSDGNLDLFTVNHSATQSLQLGDGTGHFQDVLSAWNLAQDREFTQLEDSLAQPEFKEPGLYIYRQDKALYLHGYNLGQKTIAGSLQLSWAVTVEQEKLFSMQIKQENQPSRKVATTIKFVAKNNGWLVIRGKDDIVEIPHKFKLDPQVSLANIHIGINKLQPNSHRFNLMWRDRHSMAWTDLNQDGKLDVFIGRGAVKGQIQQVSDRLDDELMIQTDATFKDEIEGSGMSKKDCPARQSAWVDFNNDDRLDLYVVCGRNDKPYHPNQLWQQQADGKFIDFASQLGLDFPEDGCFRWLDGDGDGDMDLLAAREKAIELWINRGDRFEPHTIVKVGKAKIMNLAIADFDLDGDLDAYASSKYVEEPNLLLVNHDGKFKAVNPQTIGLPEKGINGAWVDYDRDGLSDLQLVPQGIYRQLSNHQFKSTNLLNFSRNFSEIVNARGVWFDFDNDGAEDYLIAAKQTPSLLENLKTRLQAKDNKNDWQKIWRANLYRNIKPQNHWLQISLSASLGNPLGIGTTVVVTTSQGKQLQQVGNTDNSYYSQGHYRLYFGLGKDERVKAIDLKWSDGQTQHLENLLGDRLLVIDKNVS